MNVTQPERHEKRWGMELWIVNKPEYCAKILRISPGKRGSIHYHLLKDETFCVLSGTVSLRVWENGLDSPCTERYLHKGDTVHIARTVVHQIGGVGGWFDTEEEEPLANVFEVSTQHFESDSYRVNE